MSVGNIIPPILAKTARVDGVQSERSATTSDTGSSEQTGDVSRSDILQFIQDLKDDASQMPNVRADLVEQAKADISAGSLGSDADLNATINALLVGF